MSIERKNDLYLDVQGALVILRAMPLTTIPLAGWTRLATVLVLSAGFAREASAQQSRVTMLDFSTGSEMEDYLRVMQIAGKVPLYPWSIRGFSRREITRLAGADSTGPWKLRDRLSRSSISVGPLRLGTIFNSAFPYGANDGPVWAGRGLTSVVSGGFAGRMGPLSINVDPLAFRASNTSFELLSNGKTGPQAFNHGTFPNSVDLPQRFGDTPYSRLDPGNSSIRLDSRFLSVGLSTANEWIGPATEYPFLLGTNAPGFPHVFVGTGDPANIWLGRLHVRLLWGRLDQSAYSPVTGGQHFIDGVQTGSVRLAAAAEGVFTPRGIPGLELGFGRFIHVPYRNGEPTSGFWAKPFKVFFNKNEIAQGDTLGADNQLASLFFRWAFPHSGLEIYGERGYEDQFNDLRELIENIDHDRAYILGFQKVLGSADTSGADVLKGEVVNYQLSTLALLRGEGAVYLHSPLRQGHTNRGQLLGASPGVNAAAASVLSWTRYRPRSRTAVTLHRIVRDQEGNYQRTGIVDPKGSDIIIALGFEQMRFGRVLDVGGKLEGMRDLNRNFVRDVSNLNLELTARFHR